MGIRTPFGPWFKTWVQTMVVVTSRELQFPNYANVVADLQKGLRNPAAQGPECLSFRFSGRIVGFAD